MISEWLDYLYSLDGGYGYFYFQSGVPDNVIIGVQFVALFLFLIWSLLDRKNYIVKGIGLLLVDYIVILVCSTIIFRPESAETGLRLEPFWKLFAIGEGKEQFYLEIALNILVFIPIGFFAGILLGEKSFKRVVIIGGMISLGIEVGQLISAKGVAEIDDLIHNTLGCAMGYVMAMPVIKAYNKLSKTEYNCRKEIKI